jgi:hypothetical protein
MNIYRLILLLPVEAAQKLTKLDTVHPRFWGVVDNYDPKLRLREAGAMVNQRQTFPTVKFTSIEPRT